MVFFLRFDRKSREEWRQTQLALLPPLSHQTLIEKWIGGKLLPN